MAVAIPEAFGERALLFAGAYVAIQVGRARVPTFVVARPGSSERERGAHILDLVLLRGGVFWLAAALAGGRRASRSG